MAKLTLYHNPNCSKSRQARDILEKAGASFELVEYLKTPLSVDEIGSLLGKLDTEPAELVRKDSRFNELGLDAADYQDPDAVSRLLDEHPELMQRPVLVSGSKAVIARPPELVEELL